MTRNQIFISVGVIAVIVTLWAVMRSTNSEKPEQITGSTNGDSTTRRASNDYRNDDRTKSGSDDRTISERRTDDRELAKNDEKTPDTTQTTQWVDPVNQRVLGPKSWMVEASDEENQKIDEVFEKARSNRDKRINSKSRQHSIEAMRAAVTHCLDELQERNPDATGRLIVSWTASAGDNGIGTVADLAIDTNVGLRDPQFESCVLDNERLRFESDPGEPLRVEYPFMFDETNPQEIE